MSRSGNMPKRTRSNEGLLSANMFLQPVMDDSENMESDESTDNGAGVYRKRTLEDLHMLDKTSDWAEQAADLESSMKKVRISKQFPGQIRLNQDVVECQSRLAGLSIAMLRQDPRTPLQVRVMFMNGKQYDIITGRYYPHQCPCIIRVGDGGRVDLPLFQRWVPVFTLGDILTELLRYS